jgi:hypothetical protein
MSNIGRALIRDDQEEGAEETLPLTPRRKTKPVKGRPPKKDLSLYEQMGAATIDDICARYNVSETETRNVLALVHRLAQAAPQEVTLEDAYAAFCRGRYSEVQH